MALKSAVASVFVAALVAVGSSGALAQQRSYAFADFHADNGNQCTETFASLDVVDNPAFDPDNPLSVPLLLIFHWDVIGQPTSPGCDPLYYYYLDGIALLYPSELVIAPSRGFASLDKVVTVFDGEGGVTFDVLVQVQWTLVQRHGRKSVAATMSVTSINLDPRYTLNPLDSTSAGLTRLNRLIGR